MTDRHKDERLPDDTPISRSTSRKRGLIALLAALAVLVLCDLALRAYTYSRTYSRRLGVYHFSGQGVRNDLLLYDPDPVLLWRFRPGVKIALLSGGRYHFRYEIGRHGFRTPDFDTRKSSGVYRITCLGDSRTAGSEVELPDTYASQLHKVLNAEKAGRFEVINAGTDGYTSFQGLNLLRTRIVQFKPDLVVFAFDGNNDQMLTDETDAVKLRNQTKWSIPVRNFLAKSALFLTLERHLLHIASRSGSGERAPPTPRMPPREYASVLHEAAAVADKHGIQIVFLVIPNTLYKGPEQTVEQVAKTAPDAASHFKAAEYLARKGEHYQAIGRLAKALESESRFARAHHALGLMYEGIGEVALAREHLVLARRSDTAFLKNAYRTAMVRVAKEVNVPLIDCTEAMARRIPERLFCEDDVDHPNPRGHRVIAEELARGIREILADAR